MFALGRKAKMESGGKRHTAADAVMRCPTKAAGGRKGSFQLTVQCGPSGKEGQQQELGAAGCAASTVRKQRAMHAGTRLTFSFL